MADQIDRLILQDLASQNLKRIKDALEAEEDALRIATAAAEANAVGSARMDAATRAAAARVQALRDELRGAGREMDTAGRSAITFRNRVADIGHVNVDGLVDGLAVGAAATVTGLGAAVKTAIDFQVALAGLAKATDLSGSELNRMRDGLETMSVRLKTIPLDKIYAIATTGAKLGVATGDLLEYTEGIVKVSSAMDDIPAAEIADQIGKINIIFGLGVKGSQQFGSAIDRLADSGASSAADILNVTQRISGVASATKISGPETVALAAALLDTGTEAEAAAGALTQMIQGLTNVENRGAFAETIGASADEFAQMVNDRPIMAIKQFLEALARLDAGTQQTTLANIGIEGVRGAGNLQKLAIQTGSLTKYIGFANYEFKTLNQLTKSFEIQSGLTQTSITGLWNQVQIAARTVGEELIPAMTSLISLANEANKSFADAFGLGPVQAFGESLKAVADAARTLNKLQSPDKAKAGQQDKGQQLLDSANIAILDFFGAGDTGYAKRLKKRLQDATDAALGSPMGTPAPTKAEIAAAGANPAAQAAKAAAVAAAAKPAAASADSSEDAGKEEEQRIAEDESESKRRLSARKQAEERRVAELAKNIGGVLEREALEGKRVDPARVQRALAETQGVSAADAARLALPVGKQVKETFDDRLRERAGEKGIGIRAAGADILAEERAKKRKDEVTRAEEKDPILDRLAKANASAAFAQGGTTAAASAVEKVLRERGGVSAAAAKERGKTLAGEEEAAAFDRAAGGGEARRTSSVLDAASLASTLQSAIGGQPDFAKQQVDKLEAIRLLIKRQESRIDGRPAPVVTRRA